MISEPPAVIAKQLSRACAVIHCHLSATLQAIHLFGSALDGGLKPGSDIDLLVTVDVALDASIGHSLMRDLLEVSSPPGNDAVLRPLELTVIARSELTPWHYPPRRELQFGEWLRQDILAGVFEPAVHDHDLAILLTQVRQSSLALHGPPADALLAPVPAADFSRALADTLAQWRRPAGWRGDERNVVLALARICYSAATGRIAAKDAAADWLLQRLPTAHRSLLEDARAAYLGIRNDNFSVRDEEIAAFVRYVGTAISALATARGRP